MLYVVCCILNNYIHILATIFLGGIMKIFLKKNKLLLICLLLLLSCVILSLVKYKIDFNHSIDEYNRVMEYLDKNSINSPIIPKKPIMYDTYSLFSYIIVDSPFAIIMYVMPFIIMLCGIYSFYSKIKTGYFKDECMRRNYKKNLIVNIFDSWKNAIIIPIFIIVLFAGCYITTRSFDINKTIEFYDYSLINRQYLDKLPTYFITYTINLIFLAIFYINISIITAKKNSNLFVTLVQSYLIFIIVGIITEVVVGKGLEKIFPILKSYNLCNSLSIFNFWVYDNVMNLSFMTLFAFLLFFVSTLIVILKYRNKESVIIEIDK